MLNWILTLLFGTGAVITPVPVNLAAGETFFGAAMPLTPANDTMTVAIDLGKATEEKKHAVLSGAMKLHAIADVKVEVCKSQTECVAMDYYGPYFTRDSYGISFYASGPQLKHSKFVGVRISTDRPMNGAAISWGNYSQ